MFGHLGIVAASLFSAQAFLLPPGISIDTSNKGLDLPANNLINPKSQRIQIPCPSCTFPSKTSRIDDHDDNNDFTNDYDLLLEFRVSHDGERLQLNNEPIYPPHFHRSAFFEQGHAFHVDLVPAGDARHGAVVDEAPRIPLEVTASGVKIGADRLVSDHGDAVVPLTFQIIGLEGQRVNVEVAIHLLRTSDNELLIMRVEPSDDQAIPALPSRPQLHLAMSETSGCTFLPRKLCALRNQLLAKIEGAESSIGRPCHAKTGSLFAEPEHLDRFRGFGGRPNAHHGRPHHVRPYSTEPHHHHGRNVFRAFARGLIAVLIPVMAGICVGLGISFLGLVVGRLIGLIWIRYGRGEHGYGRIMLDETDPYDSKLFLVEPPPQYEDAPAYEDIEKR